MKNIQDGVNRLDPAKGKKKKISELENLTTEITQSDTHRNISHQGDNIEQPNRCVTGA